MTSGSLWNYYRDKIVDTDDNASRCESFKSFDDGNPQPQPDQMPRNDHHTTGNLFDY